MHLASWRQRRRHPRVHASATFSSVVAALFSIGACGSPVMSSSSPQPASTRIIAVLGDSLSVSPSRDASFPAVLQKRLNERGSVWRVLNFGRNGDTTGQGLARVDEVLAAQPEILVLALGANDGLRGVPVETVGQQLDTIIRRAAERGARVLLCGMDAPPLRGWRYSLDFHGLYPRLAKQYDLPLVPFLLTGVIGDPELNREDRVHPNARGAQRIADTIWPVLEPMLQAGADRVAAAGRRQREGAR
jgi:acyl-CoA thioesterase I